MPVVRTAAGCKADRVPSQVQARAAEAASVHTLSRRPPLSSLTLSLFSALMPLHPKPSLPSLSPLATQPQGVPKRYHSHAC